MISRHHRARLFWLAFTAICGAFVIVPILTLLVQAAADRWHGSAIVPQQFGARGLRSAWRDPLVLPAIGNSLLVAAATVCIALALAWPAARALALDARRSLRVLMLVPLLVPPLAIGEGLSPWFFRLGLADSLGAIVLSHLVTVLPYVTLALVPGFTRELVELEHAAATLGAGRARRAFGITIPAVRRHLALAVALGFTVSWSQYGTSLVVGGGIPMLPVVLVPFVRSDPQVAAVLDLVFLAPPFVIIAMAAMMHQHGARTAASTPSRVAPRGP